MQVRGNRYGKFQIGADIRADGRKGCSDYADGWKILLFLLPLELKLSLP